MAFKKGEFERLVREHDALSAGVRERRALRLKLAREQARKKRVVVPKLSKPQNPLFRLFVRTLERELKNGR